MTCQTNGNSYMIISNGQTAFSNSSDCQQIEPIMYIKGDENNEEASNSATSYMELRSMVEVPVTNASNTENANQHDMPQL